MVTAEHQRAYQAEGYAVVQSLFSRDEADRFREHYMRLREAGTYPGDSSGVDTTSADPLLRYPRMIHMHRWDDISLRWLVEPRLNACMTALLGREPFAVQTMLYFKPAGARGQALHQDQHYLRVQPGTCMAAWMALDRCDEENGCLQVVPGSHRLPMLCTKAADTSVSFTDVTVPVPEDMPVVPVVMEPGDVLFFNGQLIHGSFPNVSRDRFRRALIGHYIAGEAEKVAGYYHPVLRMDGSEVTLDMSDHGGPCGVFRDVDGKPSLEMVTPGSVGGPLHE